MSVARKLKEEPQTKIFHGTMLVTRAEEWWVEAETLEEAQALPTRNLPLLELKAGSLLQIGRNAILRVTGLRKPCVKIGRLGKGLQAAVTMRGDKFAFMKGAVIAVVIAGGNVSPGNAIRVQQPAGTAKFLQPV